MERIAIIGAGNVGGALYRSLRGVVGDDALVVCDTHEAQLAKLGAGHALRDADAAVRLADTVIVAVKPQQFAALAHSVTAPLEGKFVVTVMAGVTLAAVAQALGAAAVVRCMPNLGAQIGRGATAWIASPACTAAQLELARRIFRAAGIEIEVRDESLLDAFTALGGTGPAYYFYLTELLAENAVAMGFDVEQARAPGAGGAVGKRATAGARRAIRRRTGAGPSRRRAGRPRPRCARLASMTLPRPSAPGSRPRACGRKSSAGVDPGLCAAQ